jgi:hypothetical protein
VAAREHHPELVVVHGDHLIVGAATHRRAGGHARRPEGLLPLRGGLAVRASRLAPDPVERPVAGGGRDPGARSIGHAPAGPGTQRLDERLLHRVLGRLEITQHAGEGGERPPGLRPERALDHHPCVVHRMLRVPR